MYMCMVCMVIGRGEKRWIGSGSMLHNSLPLPL